MTRAEKIGWILVPASITTATTVWLGVWHGAFAVVALGLAFWIGAEVGFRDGIRYASDRAKEAP